MLSGLLGFIPMATLLECTYSIANSSGWDGLEMFLLPQFLQILFLFCLRSTGRIIDVYIGVFEFVCASPGTVYESSMLPFQVSVERGTKD